MADLDSPAGVRTDIRRRPTERSAGHAHADGTAQDGLSVLRELQRVVFPASRDRDVLPLYVTSASVEPMHGPDPWQILDRRRLRVAPQATVSFATYFNAFPASYWQRWSRVQEVELVVRLSAAGTVTVWSSDAQGRATVVSRRSSDGGACCFGLPLTGFDEGGWYWFDVTGGQRGLVVESAAWRTPVTAGMSTGSITVGVTTLDRPTYVLDLLSSLAQEPEVLAVLDEVLVVDQGSDRVRARPGFAAAETGLGGRLRVLEQPNLGGSGGFARSMAETMLAGRSRYLLLMDDDVAVEPESLLRALAFADLARQPTLVGGHMFDLFRRARLHSFGEVVRPERFEWGPADGVEPDHDFGARGLAGSPWMHRRFDVDYTAWWMCLVPVSVLESVGLSAPFFIAWDDAEFGVRAGAAGVPTVTLPGVAIWHMPFTTKSDASDWKSYFEERNRLLTALLHAPADSSRGIVGSSLRHQLRHLMSMQYAAAELRLAALEDLLEGPDALHPALPSRLGAIRELRSRYDDAVIAEDLHGFPAVRDRVLGRHPGPATDPSRRAKLAAAAHGVVNQARPASRSAGGSPQALLPSTAAVWWRLARLDSALVWTKDGAGVRSYRRDRATFTRLLRRTLVTYSRLLRQWEALSARYRSSWPDQTSLEAWRRSLPALGPGVPGTD